MLNRKNFRPRLGSATFYCSQHHKTGFDRGAQKVFQKSYTEARKSITDLDPVRSIPVLSVKNADYSGFHQGAGEGTLMEILSSPFPKYALVLIDEIETSLHPRAQRRLIRDLADRARLDSLQIILTTHSPHVLEEIPSQARLYIDSPRSGKTIFEGVSSFYALSAIDEKNHPGIDVYVEDPEACTLLAEILSFACLNLRKVVQLIPFGSAAVGKSLGQIVNEKRFTRPTVVFLDGDQEAGMGYHLLPGNEAPEKVIFKALQKANWCTLAGKLGRHPEEVASALEKSMNQSDHHLWINEACIDLSLDPSVLWQAMCADYVSECLCEEIAEKVIQAIKEAYKYLY